MKANPLLYGKRVKIWPLALMMITILLVVFGLHNVADQKDDWDLSCDASMYKPDAANDHNHSVKLTVKSHDGHVVISYDYMENGVYQGSIRMTGDIIAFEVSSLTLHIKVTAGEALSSLNRPDLPNHFKRILDDNFAFLSRVNNGVTLSLQMSEMDLKRGFAVLNFFPGNNIWACDIQAD